MFHDNKSSGDSMDREAFVTFGREMIEGRELEENISMIFDCRSNGGPTLTCDSFIRAIKGLKKAINAYDNDQQAAEAAAEKVAEEVKTAKGNCLIRWIKNLFNRFTKQQ